MHISSLFKEIEQPKDNLQEFQIVGKEIQTWCNLKKFPLSLFMTYNHEKIKEAFKRIQKTEIHSIGYLVGIIKKLK
jgi:hypothetical protein